ncbi:glycosyltransferase family 2 protein [Parabacteroides sp. AD58]|uniref:Glycosyltransferase family 2 protein n=1 Tax=Parabacteroides absconsus TaxID=2951805 RepID=A0ABZ2IRA4_9BACT|nr:glycosyltransferase family 2 protein [Parabacteroides sp. AD58]MCM6901001.1 glycosyltransferase family 2 protein [Parabacteroides sp. AD58]
MKHIPRLLLIVPCYNEEEVLPETIHRLTDMLALLKQQQLVSVGHILIVDDGSTDNTWQMIEAFALKHKEISGLKLVHNSGHQQALWAGLEYAVDRSDVTISVDADLQDDIRVIPQMLTYYLQGIDIVYGIRKERKSDTFLKRFSAQLFYKVMGSLTGDIIYNHADFRLISNRALQALLQYPERNLFLRGLVSSLGFPSAMVYYDRQKRPAGQSKYPLCKMLSFAAEGITSFSIRPLQGIVLLGLLFILISVGVIIYAIAVYWEGETIPGWTSILVSLWLIGGSMMTAIGIIGEYIGKIYKEVKKRPRYLVDKTTEWQDDNQEKES